MSQVNLAAYPLPFNLRDRASVSLKGVQGREQKKDQQDQVAEYERAAVGIESMFIHHILSEMQKGVQTIKDEENDCLSPASISAGDKGSGNLFDLAYTAVGDQLAAQKVFGIADWILDQINPLTQELSANSLVVTEVSTK